MSAAAVAAQAKVNLVLRVLGKREDGYHDLETVFQRVDLADDVRVRVSPRTAATIDMRGADVGPVEHNLAFRAARVYQEAVGWPAGFSIEIEKRIPMGGGLGGGSADAGAVLRALDALAPRPIGARLLELAARLGSDVPFLTADFATALGRGRGERLEPLPALPSRPLLLLNPGFSVLTADAYGWLAAEHARRVSRQPLAAAALGGWSAVAAAAVNDLAPVVEARHEILQSLREKLREMGAEVAMLSGSGATVFGVFERTPGIDRRMLPGGVVPLLSRTSDRVVPVARYG